MKVHVEVENNARKIFGRRMFRYFCRIFDKHEPVISIALFLEKRTRHNAPVYSYSYHGTKIEFVFNSIYVAELDEIELSKSVNSFAKILLIAKIVTQKDLGLQDIFDKKKSIARQLLNMNLPADKIRRLLNFLTAYIHFEAPGINNRFDEELKLLTNKSETMGITEQIREIFKQEGIEAGIQTSIEEISKKLLKKEFDINLIHEITSMPLHKLKKLKKNCS